MTLAFAVRILAVLLAVPSGRPGDGLPQSSVPAQADQTSSSPGQAKPAASPAASGSKSCPKSADSTSAKPPHCTSAASQKPKPHTPTETDTFSPGAPVKTVVRNGGTSDTKVAISPGMSDQQASQKLENTNRLLSSTDANLKQIAPRQLSASQQDTVKQIKSYMDQAKVAESNGDVERAYTLASKANMLSADLVQPRR
ncbi:MAG TPA: hypothetical protein VEK33_08520 [Terriglobales bacterium]|nr:hypothetical protein [Terriglobales bacterium]